MGKLYNEVCCLLPREARIPQPDIPVRITGFERVVVVFSPRGGLCPSDLFGLVTIQRGQPHSVQKNPVRPIIGLSW